MKRLLLLTTIFLIAITTTAEAKHRHKHHNRYDANGNRVASCTIKSSAGATARVGCAYAATFQGYIADLEANGADIKFLGGYRRGRCSSRHLHSCGKAIDVCQLSRGRVDSRCNLPSRPIIANIARSHGIFEGGQWCNHDYGHAQIGVSAPACGQTLTASIRKHHRRYAGG